MTLHQHFPIPQHLPQHLPKKCPPSGTHKCSSSFLFSSVDWRRQEAPGEWGSRVPKPSLRGGKGCHPRPMILTMDCTGRQAAEGREKRVTGKQEGEPDREEVSTHILSLAPLLLQGLL